MNQCIKSVKQIVEMLHAGNVCAPFLKVPDMEVVTHTGQCAGFGLKELPKIRLISSSIEQVFH